MQKDPSANSSSIFSLRLLYVFVAVILFLAMGLVYAWSIFMPFFIEEFAWSPAQTGLGFTILMSCFCIGGVLAGFILRTRSARFVVQISALLFLIGFLGTSRLSSLLEFYCFLSICVGFGSGMVYNAVISTILKWYPDKQGLISGTLMMAFGLGSFVLSTVGVSLLTNFGWRTTFVILGISYFILVLVSSFFVLAPSAECIQAQGQSRKKVHSRLDLAPQEMLKKRSFQLFFTWSSILIACGLIVIANAASIAKSLGAAATFAGVLTGVIAISNGFGRLVTGYIYDKKGYTVAMPLLSIGFVLAGLCLLFAIYFTSIPLLLAGFIFTGLSYGGIPPSNSVVISTFYGTKHYPLNFSISNMSILVGSFLGPSFGGKILSLSSSYSIVFIMLISFAVISFFPFFAMKKRSQ